MWFAGRCEIDPGRDPPTTARSVPFPAGRSPVVYSATPGRLTVEVVAPVDICQS